MKSRKLFKAAAVVAVFSVIAACSSPEERVDGFTRSGEALLENGQMVEASLEFRNALQINQDHLPALRGFLAVREADEEPTPEVRNQIAGLLNRIIDLDPSDNRAKTKLARIALIDGFIDRAFALSETVLETEPENVDALVISGGALLRLEDSATAIDRATSALAIDPENLDAQLILVVERIIAEDLDGAIALIDERSSEGEPNLALSLIKIQTLEQMEDIDGAIAIYEQLIALEEDDVELRRSYAGFLVRNNRVEPGREVMQSLVAEYPEDAEAVAGLIGLVLATEGNPAAQMELQSFIDADGDRLDLLAIMAELKIASSDIEGAADVLSQIIQDAGNSEEGLRAKVMLAGLEASGGSTDSAADMIEEVLSADDRQSGALELRASLAIEEGRIDDAIIDLRTALDGNPDAPSVLTKLGRAHELSGAVELADEQFAKAAIASGFSVTPSLAYSDFLLRQDRADRAEEVMNAVLQRFSASTDAWRKFAEIKIRRADWLGAQLAAERLEELGDDVSVSEQIAGVANLGLDRADESIAAFQRAYDAAPSQGRPLTSLVRAYVTSGRINDAETFLRSVANANPDNALASVLLGQILSLQGRIEDAEASLIAARSADPTETIVHQALYQFYQRQGDADAATDAINAGLASAPEDSGLILLDAIDQESKGAFDVAIQRYEQLVAEYPNSEIAVNNLAALITEHSSDEDMLNRARQLAERFRSSDIPHFRDTLAWAYFRTGRVNAAVDILEGVVEQAPNVPIFRYHLGLAYVQQGRAEDGAAELQAAIELAETTPFLYLEEAQRALDEVDS
ncbi:MAG: tetratricopeptide repeat protein [Pseudomonadota bacterium]